MHTKKPIQIFFCERGVLLSSAVLGMLQEPFIVSWFGLSPKVKIITLALPSFQAVWMTLVIYWRAWGGRGSESRFTHTRSTLHPAFLQEPFLQLGLSAAVIGKHSVAPAAQSPPNPKAQRTKAERATRAAQVLQEEYALHIQ